jgi:hypothetical protein
VWQGFLLLGAFAVLAFWWGMHTMKKATE